MPARADAEPATTVLLTIDAGSTVWALPSAAVSSVEPFADGDPEPPTDVQALLGAAPADAGPARRVVTVQVSGQRLRLLARGGLRLRTVSGDELVPLPPVFERSSPLVSHVALVDGAPALLLVSPERLLHALQTSNGFTSSPSPHRPEAPPC